MYNFITLQSNPKKVVINTNENNLLELKVYTKRNSVVKRIKRGVRVIFTKTRPMETNELGSGLKTIITSFKNKKVIEVSQLGKHERYYKRL